ncbi:TBC domain-containing protein C23D3.03c [Lachnellula arida]|uniref:TBC domain-containing protein C23D3.03c n=1 Tax=Lachnellula arida TaxID=1316785 RepID=A0A8T9BCN5_9HELO|nr:TBC domain-containing protein C23D3.03c [Lachnellula arida]
MTSTDDAVSNRTMPGSPPDLTGSKSSKSSSFHSSYQSDDNTILSDVGNFEDIGLDDESRVESEIGDFGVKKNSNPYDATFANDPRATAKQRKRVPMQVTHGNRSQRELTTGLARPSYPSLRNHVQSATAVEGLGLTVHNSTTMSRRGFTSPSTPALIKRNRSPSPNLPANNLGITPLKARRSSWQANRERKTAKQLEKECDDDDDDDAVPDDCLLENIPISPRPPQERIASRPASTSASPERPVKEKVRSVGNGTSPIPAEQGVLRSPGVPKPGMNRGASMGQSPINHAGFPKRTKSWNIALSELSEEAKALTEALEAHAEEEETRDPNSRRSYNPPTRSVAEKGRVKSAIAELPPLRRTNIMIDPLPISKEKEAVLSRTRPSWLPPKDPAEEKRHLKEYQRMMTLSIAADRKKEVEQRAKSTCKDDTVSSLLRIWEEHVLPNWDEVTRQKRTRELWWRGIAPRSRGKVWARAIGNELGLSESSYTAALRRAQNLEKTIKSGSQLSKEEMKKKGWLDRIEEDVKRTYPELRIFQREGPLHGALLDVLKAYAMYRSDVGYVHGTSTIAALLLLNLPTSSLAFQTLSNILNRPLPLSFHTSDTGATSRTYYLLLSTLKRKSPQLHTLLTNPDFNLQPDMYMKDIFSGAFTGVLSLDNCTRLWDVMVFEGDAVLVRAGVAYLLSLENRLLGAGSAKEICEVVRAGLEGVDEDEWVKRLRSAGKSA